MPVHWDPGTFQEFGRAVGAGVRGRPSRVDARLGVEARLTQQPLAESEGRTSKFSAALNRRIYDSVRVVIREAGKAYPPDETVRRGEGACRDLAWLFVSSSREVGLAALS